MTRDGYNGFLGNSSDAGAVGAAPRLHRTAAPASDSPAVENLARTLAVALARTIRAYLPIETRSVEARLDALDAEMLDLDRRIKALTESLAQHREMT